MFAVFEFIVTGTPSIMIAFDESRPPFTVKRPIDSNPSPTPPLAPPGRKPNTPGVNAASAYTLRPFKGRSMIRLFSTTPLNVAVVVSTAIAAPVTVTLSDNWPTCNDRFSSSFCCVAIDTDSTLYERKPDFSARSLYRPGGSGVTR